MRGRTQLAALLLLVFPNVAAAHDVWLTFKGDTADRRVIVNYGHPNDRPPAFSDKVVDLVLVTRAGRKSLLEGLTAAVQDGIGVAESKPFNDEQPGLVAARYDNGFWAKLSETDYRNATSRLIRNAKETMWSGKFAKALTGQGAPWQTVVGHEIEIVPLSDPLAARPGQSLQVRVLFRGKPLRGAKVERSDGITNIPEKDIPRFTTDAGGVATVPIVKAGAHLLVVDHTSKPSLSPRDADVDLYNATFWFSLP